MLNELLLHPVTESTFNAMLLNPPQALLLQGKRGMGKGFLASILASVILQCKPAQLTVQPYFLHIAPENDVIKIEQIRALKQFLQLKTTGRASIRRVVIIEDIMTMGDEAQNALLKMLEEPPADTVIILTSTTSSAVRPTVISRCQRIAILPPPKSLIQDYYKQKGYRQPEITKALAMSQGSIGLMHALLTNQNHPYLIHVQLAKDILTATEYQRLITIDRLAKDRLAIESLLEALSSICNVALQQASHASDVNKLKRWYRSIKAVDQASQSLRSKPSGKLLLTNLFLQL